MLNDPEREEWLVDSEPILADSYEEAKKLCQQEAERRGLRLVDIEEPKKKGGKRYVCIFGGFIEKQEQSENS